MLNIMNNNVTLLNYRHIRRTKYHYNIPKDTDYRSKIASCLYKTSTSGFIRPLFEFPKLKTLSGIYKVNNNYYIDLEIPLETSNTSEKTLYEFLSENDEHHIMTTHNNCREWFNGQIFPMKVIQQLYQSSLILSTEGKNPFLKVKIPTYRGKIMIEIFNQDREQVNMDYICAGDELMSIIEMVGLEFFENKFLGEYEVHKIKVFKNNFQSVSHIPTGYIFSDKPKIDLKKLPNIDNVQVEEPEPEQVNEEELAPQVEEPTTTEDIPAIEPEPEAVPEIIEEKPIVSEEDIVTDTPVIPQVEQPDTQVEPEPIVETPVETVEEETPIELEQAVEVVEDEYYSDSEYELDDDIEDHLVDLTNIPNEKEENAERERIMNMIKERENELMKLKEQLEVK